MPPLPPVAVPADAARKSIDPFAKTILGKETSGAEAGAFAPTQEQPMVSPKAASVWKDPAPALPGLAAKPAAAVPAQPPLAQAARPQAPPFAPGGTVLVYWADGNQYRGTVLQVSPYHVLVAFPNGVQHWIEMRYVTAGR